LCVRRSLENSGEKAELVDARKNHLRKEAIFYAIANA